MLAQQTELALRSAGYQVFFDRKDLPAGESFDVRILEAIEQSDLLIYLVSPASVKPGAYALTELGFARKRWRHPDRRIIPVMVGPVSLDALPPYLRAVTLLEPEGNVVAEILESVNALSGWRRYKRRIVQGVAGSAAVVALIAIVALWQAVQEGDCRVAAATARNVSERMLDAVAEANVSEAGAQEQLDAINRRPDDAFRAGLEVDPSDQIAWDRQGMDAHFRLYQIGEANDRRLQTLASQGREAAIALAAACGADVDDEGWTALIEAPRLSRAKFQQRATELRERAMQQGAGD